MNKQIKFILTFLSIFTLMAVGTTYMLITNNRQNVLNENNDNQAIKTEVETGIDLYGMYNENDLVINDLLETYSGDEIKIPQIEGLKNIEIQKEINKDIYNRCYELLNSIEIIDDGTINKIETLGDGTIKTPPNYRTSYYEMANFSNVISIHYIVEANGHFDSLYFNYNLVTGDRLKFEDLFVKDADIIEIVRKAFLERISNTNYWENAIEGDYIASFDENELYKIVKGFMDDEEKEFMFSPSNLYIYYKNYGANVKMIDIAGTISIYTKYLTDENIFERNDIGRKDIFTLVETNYDVYESIEYGYIEDNFWYDVTFGGLYLPDKTISEAKLEKYKLLEDSIMKEVYSKVEEYRETAKNNPDKYYFIFIRPVLRIYNDAVYENGEWTYTYSNMAIIRLYTRIYEMPLEVYENTYKDKLIDAYRYKYFVMSGGAQIIPESGDGAIFKEDIDERVYDYINNVRITELTDIFYEDSDYESIIKDNVRNVLNFDYRTDDEIERLLNTMKYELIGNHIAVTIPEIEDFKRDITFYEFPKEMIKLFDKED